MTKFSLHDTGPFTPAEAARRVKLASQRLKWFTLCHPHWSAAHCSHQWKTTFPLPPLALPKGVRMTLLNSVEGEFDTSDPEGDGLNTALKAGAKLAGLADCSISSYRRTAREKPGLNSLRLELTPQGDWDVAASVYHLAVKTKGKALTLAVETGQVSGIKGWKLTEMIAGYRKNSCARSTLSLKLRGGQLRQWMPSIKGLLNAPGSPFRQAGWFVSFKYKFVEDDNWWVGSRCIWKPTDEKPPSSKDKTPEELLKLVSKAGFPSGKAGVGFECTVDRVADFLGLFKLAAMCEPGLEQPIGIFETERGKQGFLMFRAEQKGIKLIVQYGQNGWEDLHQELRKTNGQLDFSTKRQS